MDAPTMIADSLGTTTSLIAVLQLSAQVVGYIVGVSGATKERRRLRESVLACESIIFQLQDYAEDADAETKWWEKIKALEGPNAPLYQLGMTLDVIKAKLEPKIGFRKPLSSLTWPFDEKEIERLISSIEREKLLLQLVLIKECRGLIKNIKDSSTENGKLLVRLIQAVQDKSNEDETQAFELNTTMKKMVELLQDLREDVGKLRDDKVDLKQQENYDWVLATDIGSLRNDFISRDQAATGQWLLIFSGLTALAVLKFSTRLSQPLET